MNEPRKITGLMVVMSAPRLTFTDSAACVLSVVTRMGVPTIVGQGAFWSHSLSDVMQDAIGRGAQYILTVDYDTIFTLDDVKTLCNLMLDHPEVDAVCGLQMKRNCDKVLLAVDEPPQPGEQVVRVDVERFEQDLMRLGSGHFGLTLFRVSALRKLSKPWFLECPDEHGEWGPKKTDPDIYFWREWQKAGLTLFQANRVVLGHLQLLVTWPDQQMKPIHQYLPDYRSNGKPEEVWQ